LETSTCIPAAETSPDFARHSTARLSQPHAGAAAVLVDELHTGRFKRVANDLQSRTPWLVHATLELTNCDNTHAGFAGKLMLAPIKESSGRSALVWRNH
jgi:hypothetical protein